MFSSRQSIMPIGRPIGRDSVQEPGLADANEYVQSATKIAKNMSRCRNAAYGSASCLRSEALQVERLTEILDCAEFAVLVREDATRRHQDHLKATIEPQIQALLEMTEERRLERQRTEEKIKRRASNLQHTGTPRSENAAVRREELLLQHKERLAKEIQKLNALYAEGREP